MPRTAQALGEGRPWYSPHVGLASIMDQASLPGRAYVSLGRPQGERYLDAVARTSPRMDLAGYQGEGDEMAESILRDPTLPLGVGLGKLLSGGGRLVRGLVGGAGEAGLSAGSQYADDGQVSPLGMAMAAGLGGASAIAPAGRAPRAAMISPEERAANFKNWFGDSKAVDEAGNPLVVHHGTYSQPFVEFDVSGESGLHPTSRIGAFFTPSKEVAETFGNRIEDVYISSRNPYEISAEDYYNLFSREKEFERLRGLNSQKAREAIESAASGEGGLPDSFIAKRVAKLVKEMDAAGSDALLVKAYNHDLDDIPKKALRGNWKELTRDVWVARTPTQIKSATGNRGTFDPNDPNITNFNAPTTRAAPPTMAQGLGRRVTSGAIGASLRKYLQDDRPQGDTPYTRAR